MNKKNATKEPATVKDETIEEPVKVEEKKDNLKLEDKSELELNEMEDLIKNRKVKLHLEAEADRIKNITCPECDKKLKINPKDYMKKDVLPQRVECPECKRLLTLTIKYLDEPEVCDADISLRSEGFAWESQPPTLWTDKDTKRWIEVQKERIATGTSELSIEGQKLFKILELALK